MERSRRDRDREEDSDEDYVVVGTPLENEFESKSYRRQVKDPSVARQLPAWRQEVTDGEGRRRFHGAFTGGFSAGYYNTVGSREGFEPKSFSSSRGKRAAQDDRTRSQRIEDFYDEDELAEQKRRKLEATHDYDTVASRAARQAHEVVRFETRNEGNVIPGGPLLMEGMIAPVANSIGIRMLLALGWRRGKGIGGGEASVKPSLNDAQQSRQPESVVGLGSNTPIFVPKPKKNAFGVGYDPYRQAHEFLERKNARAPKNRAAAGRATGGIGFGVFDEDDELRVDDVYGDSKGDYNFEIVDDDDDVDDDNTPGANANAAMSSKAGKSKRTLLHNVAYSSQEAIDGFQHAGTLSESTANQILKLWPPPVVPATFSCFMKKKKKGPAVNADTAGVVSNPGAPSDPKLAKTINVLAHFVAKNGADFEALARERNAFDSKFNFLNGGVGYRYYKWKVQEELGKVSSLKSKDTEPRRKEKSKGYQQQPASLLHSRFTSASMDKPVQQGGISNPTFSTRHNQIRTGRSIGQWQPGKQ